ncbi:MAG: hypothetical protein KJI72_03840 [Patescibacteria group bacterium]|nr:hypothetical protein [Patescibacteria group bacterium]
MGQKEINKQIFRQLERLEKAIFDNTKPKSGPNNDNFKGVAGGIRLLISKKFFGIKKKTFAEIKKALSNIGYHSSRQAIQAALNQLATTKGPLKKIKEGNKNSYAERR